MKMARAPFWANWWALARPMPRGEFAPMYVSDASKRHSKRRQTGNNHDFPFDSSATFLSIPSSGLDLEQE